MTIQPRGWLQGVSIVPGDWILCRDSLRTVGHAASQRLSLDTINENNRITRKVFAEIPGEISPMRFIAKLPQNQ
jgi:hypothetical protein